MKGVFYLEAFNTASVLCRVVVALLTIPLCNLLCAGYEKIEARDNFYVKAKIAHKSRQPWSELSFEKGDVFHVVDTLPAGESARGRDGGMVRGAVCHRKN